MTDLSNSIYTYYLKHLNELPQYKQFHFASRLYLWNGDKACNEILTTQRPWFTHSEDPEAALRHITLNTLGSTLGPKNVSQLRQPYFERYPSLKLYVKTLFRITFLFTVYGIDIRTFFYKLFPKVEVEAYAQALLQDSTALAILSTHAVNFLYLYYGIIKSDTSVLEPKDFLKLKEQYTDLQNPTQLQLMIYLFTHCIIGESLFYHRAIPEQQLPVYRKMVEQLGELIQEHFENVNLDCKCEFLVASKLINYDSPLNQRIVAESARSFSDKGNFIIDTHNNNPQRAITSISASEHRNVLFIMSQNKFKPNLS